MSKWGNNGVLTMVKAEEDAADAQMFITTPGTTAKRC
jgi:cyclophilin family peptidyl-prolyl cis-trans isomerase